MHVADPEFGLNVNVDAALRTLIDKLPRLGSVDAQLLLRDHYELTYGIYNHEQPNAQHPFALILQHWNEDTVTLGPLHERMNQYVDAQILKYFGMPFDDFCEQPTYVIEMMVNVAMQRAQIERPMMEAAEALMNKAQSTKVP